MTKIHYMTGTEDKMTLKTKTGCGVEMGLVMRGDMFVFWNNRGHVDCGVCRQKIEKMEQLNGSRK